MNEKIKNTLLIALMVLLLSACGGLETAPASVDTLEPVPTETPASVPTMAPIDEPASVDPSDYIGLVYPPSPEGLSKGFSMVIWGKDDHGLSLVLGGSNKMLWLEKINHYDEKGIPYWEVMDVLLLSDLEAGLTLLPDGCSLNGVPDSEIFVAGRNNVIVLAWRANTTLEKFETIPADGITCNSDKAVNIT